MEMRVFSEGHKKKISIALKGRVSPQKGKRRTEDQKKKQSQSMRGKIPWNKGSKISHIVWNKGKKLSIDEIQQKYPFFSKIEEMRYNPNKPEEKEIQVHCKNSNCKNSKEKDGWFSPTRDQLQRRIAQLENEDGWGGIYFYCSEICKKQCPLYNLRSDYMIKKHENATNKLYTDYEYQIFRTFVLERDNYICQFCGEPAIDVHHERPQKLEPFFSLDPDYAWSCCKKCHYEKGHKDECSIVNIKSKTCKGDTK